jgi:hypothetical protein
MELWIKVNWVNLIRIDQSVPIYKTVWKFCDTIPNSQADKPTNMANVGPCFWHESAQQHNPATQDLHNLKATIQDALLSFTVAQHHTSLVGGVNWLCSTRKVGRINYPSWIFSRWVAQPPTISIVSTLSAGAWHNFTAGAQSGPGQLYQGAWALGAWGEGIDLGVEFSDLASLVQSE